MVCMKIKSFFIYSTLDCLILHLCTNFRLYKCGLVNLIPSESELKLNIHLTISGVKPSLVYMLSLVTNGIYMQSVNLGSQVVPRWFPGGLNTEENVHQRVEISIHWVVIWEI